MRKLLTIVLISSCLSGVGQTEKDSLRDIRLSHSANEGRVYVEFGLGAAIQNGFSNIGRANPNQAAVRLFSRLQGSYMINQQFSIGLELRGGSYPVELDTNEVHKEITGGALGIAGTYYFLNKPKFNLFVSSSFGGATLNSYRESNTGNQEDIYANGTYMSFSSGFHALFTRRLGLHLRASYTTFGYTISGIWINGEAYEEINDQYVGITHVNFRGIELSAGITLAL